MKKTETARYYNDVNFRAAVCIPLLKDESGQEQVLFEQRSSRLNDQPGDICFPGGGLESGETAEQAVLREVCEELLIAPEQLELTEELSPFVSGNLEITPFVGTLCGYEGSFDPFETAEVFTVPLQWLLENEPENHRLEWLPEESETFPYERIVGGKNYAWRKRKESNWFYTYQGRVIWGITAKILRAWVLSLNNE